MKVIVAGMSKTGTKSMNAALSELGHKVYDFTENVYLLHDEYKKILRDGWTTEDFKRMYQDVDAVVDMPACYFWEEIHKAFPDAKIVLTMRDNEDVWFNSMMKQQEAIDGKIIFWLMEIFSPTYRRAIHHIINPLIAVVYGMLPITPGGRRPKCNEAMFKLKYRSHNAHVMKNAPADKLLVYKCSEGWDPLCKFLELPVPSTPFPHKNIRGNIVEETLETNKVYVRMQREFLVSSSTAVISVGVLSYLMITRGPTSIWNSVCNGSNAILKKLKFH